MRFAIFVPLIMLIVLLDVYFKTGEVTTFVNACFGASASVLLVLDFIEVLKK